MPHTTTTRPVTASLALLGALGLQGCIPLAIPESQTHTWPYRYQAVEVVHPRVPAGMVLINQKSPADQVDQWLVVQPVGWQFDERYDIQERDSSRATLCASLPMDQLVLPRQRRDEGEWTFVGDLVSKAQPALCHAQVWYSPRTQRFDVRHRHPRTEDNQVLATLDLAPRLPAIHCDVTTTKYTLETVVLPLPMSARTHEVGQRQVFKCVRAPDGAAQ